MKQVEVAVIGTGWCGGIRAETLSRSALVDKLHICEIRPDRLAEVKALTRPATATLDYQDIIKQPEHLGGLCLHHAGAEPLPDHPRLPEAGKHVLLEKPIAMELWEADELITLARRGRLKFTIGYSQRFNTEVRLRQEEDHRRHARQGGLGDGEPPHQPRPRQEDRQAGEALAGGDGIDPRPRFRVLAARAGQAGAGLFAGRLRLHAADQRLLRRHVDDRHHGQRHAGDHRRRLEPAAELSQLLLDLDRDHRHRGRADPRRHPPRQLAQHRRRGHPLSDVDHAGRAGRPRVRRPDGAGDHPFPRGLHPGPAGDGDAGEARAW